LARNPSKEKEKEDKGDMGGTKGVGKNGGEGRADRKGDRFLTIQEAKRGPEKGKQRVLQKEVPEPGNGHLSGLQSNKKEEARKGKLQRPVERMV